MGRFNFCVTGSLRVPDTVGVDEMNILVTPIYELDGKEVKVDIIDWDVNEVEIVEET
jgi:hypothetical protein